MKNIFLVSAILCTFQMSIAHAKAAPKAEVAPAGFEIDKAHSRIGFTIRHLGISKVSGEFRDFDAKIDADSKTGHIKALAGTVKIASINTGIEKRDEHLRAADFFDAQVFPMGSLKVKSIKITDSSVTAVADLTLKGITREVTFEGEFLGVRMVNFGSKQMRAGYSVSAKINRQDFGLKFSQLAEGVAILGDEVTIHIDAEIMRPL